MLTLCFFAHYRETLNLDRETIEKPPQVNTVGDLHQWLLSRGERWHVLDDPRLRHALNKTLCGPDTVLENGDEIAFLPMFSGG